MLVPDSFTIDNLGNVVTCPASAGTPLGQTCTTAIWGGNIDIDVSNFMPSNTTGYVNVLVDWDQSGNWAGSSSCPSGAAPEHVLVDYQVPNGYSGPLSGVPAVTGVALPNFTIGPNSGYVWVRFSITEVPVTPTGAPWVGDGSFEDGETEDYLLLVDPVPSDEKIKFQQLPLDGPEYFGHDELSTAYRREDIPTIFEGCYMADDFADLEHSPVIKIKWWGSYLENEIIEPVNRFLIVFETDVPAGVDLPYSHPGQVLLSQFVHLAPGLPLNPGEYSETWISPGGPPCNEALFEYEAVLENPFPQDPNTVYWIKIVALIEDPGVWARLWVPWQMSGLPLCDFLNLPYAQQFPYGLQIPVTRWGWHNRDYTRMDPYASTPPAVQPGEHLAGQVMYPDGTPRDVWHFQDDAVSGDVFIDEATADMPFVDQPFWFEEYYKYFWQLCPDAQQGVDGPPEIEEYSKDLAFELWTPTECVNKSAFFYTDWVTFGKPKCWCFARNCLGDADGLVEGNALTGLKWVFNGDLAIFLAGYGVKEIPKGPGILSVPNGICADFDRLPEGNALTGIKRVFNGDLAIFLANYGIKEPPKGPGIGDCTGPDYYFFTSP